MPLPSRRRAAFALSALLTAAGGAAQDGSGDRHWSFRPIAPVAAVQGDAAGLAATLDRLVAARRRAAGLSGSPAADRRTLIRRLFLDLHGLPPAPEDVAAFAHDARPDAWRRLVDRALASPRYGERWAQHWLDVVRYADTHGFEVNTPRPNAWPYRDWVIDALNADKPYDRFVVEQLAGDACGADAATGFLVAGPAVLPGQVGKDAASIRQARQDELHEIVKAAGATFLGLTIGCARCHDHKFDPVTQADYYAVQAVFAGVHYDERKLPNPGGERAAATLQPEIAALRAELRDLEPPVFAGRTLQLDDADADALVQRAGHGENPKGDGPGHRDDPGGRDRLPNASHGRYSWWRDAEGLDLMVYRPRAAGRFHLWLSWGAGFATHTRAAQYLLDRDGDPATRQDQLLLATVDQRQRALDGAAAPPGQPLWSGLRSAGTVDLGPHSAILLRGGPGAATTADVVILQDARDAPPPVLPVLREGVRSRHNVERFAPRRARAVRFTSLATNSRIEPCLDELEVYTAAAPDSPPRNVALASAGATASSSGNYPDNSRHRLPHIHDGRYGNERSWISSENGRGWVRIDLAAPAEVDRIEWGRDRNGRYADRTPLRYTIELLGEDGAWEVVATAADRLPAGDTARTAGPRFAHLPAAAAADARGTHARLADLEAQRARHLAGRRAFAGRFTAPPPTHRLHRGDPSAPREVVPAGAPHALGSLGLPADASDQARRLAFARWIASPDNPLAARVIVNRIWQHHFGTGIVDTPSDFGVAGAAPTHPELLDWLAAALVAGGWSLKHVHRIVLLSETYRQASAPRPEALRVDAGDRLLWRFAPRRLEAEAIRDSMLAVSGALDERMGGPGFSLFEPNGNYVRVYEPTTEWTPATWRRMVYAHKVRMEPDGVFGAFDCPDAGQAAPKRSRSTTALQALNLFNSSFALQQAGILARRVEGAGPETGARLTRAFELTLGRSPTAAEARDASVLVEAHGLRALCRVLLNTNEFLVLP